MPSGLGFVSPWVVLFQEHLLVLLWRQWAGVCPARAFCSCPVVLCVLIALRVGPTHHSGAACLLLQPWAVEVIAFLSSCFLRIKEKGVLVLRSSKFINELTLKKKKTKNCYWSIVESVVLVSGREQQESVMYTQRSTLFKFSSPIDHYRVLRRAPCGIQLALISYLFYI